MCVFSEHENTHNLRDRMHCDFVSLSMDILNGWIVWVFVGNEELRIEEKLFEIN